MKLTTNAIIFALINTVSTIVFLVSLNSLVVSDDYSQIGLWAVIYGLVWAISGAILGGTDRARKYRGNIDFQYSALTSAIGLSSLWVAKLVMPAIMPVNLVLLVVLSTVIVAATYFQYYLSSRSPKGIKKNEAFK